MKLTVPYKSLGKLLSHHKLICYAKIQFNTENIYTEQRNKYMFESCLPIYYYLLNLYKLVVLYIGKIAVWMHACNN